MKAVILVSCVLVTGCAVGPNYRRPDVNAPANFRGTAVQPQPSSLADLPWWEIFKDDTLKQLVTTALINNYDIAAAAARVEQARQAARQAQSEYFPQAGYTTILTYGHN